MQNFPHEYTVTTQGNAINPVIAESENLEPLKIAEPREFDGPGLFWSPEQLFVATVANCLILTFRTFAKASKFTFVDIKCHASGILDRVDNKNVFTEVNIEVYLQLESEDDLKKGQRILEKAENQCLIKNSINAETKFKNNYSA